jgi:hypothetical protein
MARTLWAMPDRTLTCGFGDFGMVLQLLTEGSLPAMHTSMDTSLWKFSTYYKSHAMPTQHPLLLILPWYDTLFLMTIYLSFHGHFGKHLQTSMHSHILTVLRAMDLGVTAWYTDQLGALEVIPISAFSGHFILAPIEVHDR